MTYVHLRDCVAARFAKRTRWGFWMKSRFIDVSSCLQSSWRLSLGDGTVVASGVKFERDGSIANLDFFAGAKWELRDGCLAFVNPQRNALVRFDALALSEQGLRVLTCSAAEGAAFTLEEEAVRRRGQPLPQAPRVAVLLRSHMLNNKFVNLWHSLQGSPLFDVYLSLDETAQKFNLSGPNILRHSVDMCRSLGLMQKDYGRYLWFFSDYPFYCAYEAIPDYDYYIQIEYDVHIARQNPLFIEGIINRLVDDDGTPFDLVGVSCSKREDERPRVVAAKKQFSEVYVAFFPFVVLSKRALLHLYERRRQEARRDPPEEDLLHCEVFVGSEMLNAPAFRCAEINQLIPNACRWSTFRVGLPMLMDSPTANVGSEIVHPAFDLEDYIAAYIRDARITNNFGPLLEAVKSHPLPSAIKEELVAFAKEINPEMNEDIARWVK